MSQKQVEMYYHISTDGCWKQPAVKTHGGRHWIPNIKWRELFPDHRYQKDFHQNHDQSDWHLHEVCQIRQTWNAKKRKHQRKVARLAYQILNAQPPNATDN